MDNALIMNKYFFYDTFTKYEELFLQYSKATCEFAAGDVISAQGDTLTHGYYIKKGIMQVNIGHEIGREKALLFMGEGALFPLGVNEHRYKVEYSIVEKAFTDVTAYRLNYLDIRRIATENPQIAMAMLEHYCDVTSFLFHEIGNQAYTNAYKKVCDCLYAFGQYGKWGNKLLPLSQDTLADVAGLSKIQVARSLRTLREQGVIATHRNCIEILSQEKLYQLCLAE